MLGVTGLMGTSGDGGASGGSSEVGASGGGMEETERRVGGGGGNRWPREETLALLNIRSEMEAKFRDSNLKGPLWEQVSRKMAELGFQRSGKKCKEKFENVYKYHKRTKDNRSSKSDGKTYKFFDQIQALENSPPPPPPPPPAAATIATPPTPISSINPNPLNSTPLQRFSSNPPRPPLMNMTASNPPQLDTFQHYSNPRIHSPSTSSTSSDEDIQPRRRGRKRKWRDFFQKILKDVIYKHEELQKKLIDTLENREKDRLAKDEAWRAQEISRLNREHELLLQERSIAAAKDTAVIAFLQKVTDQQNLKIPIEDNAPPQSPPPIQIKPPENHPPPENIAGDNLISASSSRWPKAEVETLIKLRTSLELKYEENGPKGPLWEEISIAMRKFGYSRSSKRCKEKWENINKYYKKVKESSKKRPEDSKTCPYFHLLDTIYKDRLKNNVNFMVEPIMARPEQQWPVLDGHGERKDCVMHDVDDDEDDEEEEDEGGGYEVVANKPPPAVVNTAE